jgi:hypothetical protein
MSSINHGPMIVNEPNWAPLEMVLSRGECGDYMYMGRVGEIELYKHRLTRRYLNINQDGRRFYRYCGETYVEILRSDALDHARS